MSKRKRTKNTTKDQYVMYLQYMEGDYTFRSNTINPTLGEKYLEEKWDQLCGKLNAMGDGPALSTPEWKKRFTEWKYATRSKYRKIMESRSRTGGGPQTDLKLSDIEERGLAVWGRAVVTGAADVTLYDGLPGMYIENQGVQIEEVHIENLVGIDNFEMPITMATTTAVATVATNVSTLSTPSAIATTSTIVTNVFTPLERPTTTSKETAINNVSTLSARSSTTPAPTATKNIFHKKARNKPLSAIAEKIIQETAKVVDVNNGINESLKEYINVYKEIELAKLKLEREKLDFEINKYKHKHKDFNNNL